jgi:TusA-related sulfurtransferase
MSVLEIKERVDARGLNCPMPIVKTAQAVKALASGELIEVLATDPGSMADFRGWAKTAKHALLKEQREEKDDTGRTIYVHVLEKTA